MQVTSKCRERQDPRSVARCRRQGHRYSKQCPHSARGAERYGIDIPRVQEFRSFEQSTRIAGAPLHVLGVANLRGVILPIIDMRSQLAPDVAFDSGTVTLILNVGGRTDRKSVV